MTVISTRVPAPVQTGGDLDFAMVDTSFPKGQGATKSGRLHVNGLFGYGVETAFAMMIHIVEISLME